MSRSVLAKHMGYTSLNGRALSKIGAVRAYALIEGAGDELRLTDNAIIALTAPQSTEDHKRALLKAALSPALFQELYTDFPSQPSEDNVRFALAKRGFTQDASGKAAKVYLSTMGLVYTDGGAYTPIDTGGEDEAGDADDPPPPHVKIKSPPQKEQPLMSGEREITKGLLSKEASFRLIVSGHIGAKEIDRLIQKLTLDKEILAEPDDGTEGNSGTL